MKVNVHFSLHLPVNTLKKSKWFVASCPVLDVYSQGYTEKEAKENLVEVLSLRWGIS